MDVAVRRSFDRVHPCTCLRSEGGVVRFDMHEDRSGLPHDLVHLAVEGALGLRHGFWGLLDAGASIESLRAVGGPSRPGKTSGADLVARHRSALLEAEQLVGACWDTWADGRTREAATAGLARFREGAGAAPPVWWSPDAADLVSTSLAGLSQAWEATELGDVLRLSWPPPPAS